MQYQVPSYSIKSLINFLSSHGIDREISLQLLKSDELALNDSEYFYSFDDYESLLTLGGNLLNIANIGFEYGKAFELSIWGILGHIVVAAPTLEQALYYQNRYQCLLGNTGLAEHEVDNDKFIMRWLPHPNSSANNIEHVISAWLTFAFNYTRSEEAPISVHFTHQCLTDITDYQRFFRCPVKFGDNFNGITIKTNSLTLPIISASNEMLNILTSHAEHKLANKRVNASMDIIRQYIIENLPQGVPSLEQIAAHLGISTRQLQRHFQQEQTNLTQVVENIRQHLAISYLSQSSHKLIYISTMLGYSEQSAFQRAFKRWFNLTPQAYRFSPKPLPLS